MALGRFLRQILGDHSPDDQTAPRSTAVEVGHPSLTPPTGTRPSDQTPDQPPIDEAKLAELIRQELASIPPLPPVVARLLKALGDPDVSPEKIARIVSSDPPLAAAILRVSNAAIYGPRQRVVSIEQAIKFLGFNTVRGLVVRLKLDEMLPASHRGHYKPEDLWLHSLVVSDVADRLAQKAGADRGLAATVALFHDIGKIALNSTLSDSLRQDLPEPGPDDHLGVLGDERRRFGADHAAMGSLLARHWELPDELIQAIRLHHTPLCDQALALDKPVQAALRLTYIANQISKYCCIYCEDLRIDPIPTAMLEGLRLPADPSKLLDPAVRGTISRALFYAEATVGEACSAVRRTLTVSNGPGVTELAVRFAGHPTPTVRLDGPLWKHVPEPEENKPADSEEEFCATYHASQLDFEPPSIDEARVFSAVRYVAPASQMGLDWLEKAAPLYLKHQSVPPAIVLPGQFVIRRMVEGMRLLNSDGSIICYQSIRGSRYLLGFAASGLAFDSRFPPGVRSDPEAARIVVAADLANVFNLGWFVGADISPDGDVIQLISPPMAPARD